MAIHMAKTIKEERLRWVLPIVNKEVRLKDVTKICPHGKRSLERWVAAFKRGGEEALEPKSTEPKTQPKETPIWKKETLNYETIFSSFFPHTKKSRGFLRFSTKANFSSNNYSSRAHRLEASKHNFRDSRRLIVEERL